MATLPQIQDQEVKDVTLALFGSRKTDIAPSDLPEGLTPDEGDGMYVPGEWLSRPGLAKLYATGKLSGNTSVLYEKTYVQPNDNPLTLVLTSDGILWAEDIVNNPLNPAALKTVAPGLYAQSVTEFGREYLAFSDLLRGQGVPLQFDGTNVDRVTMDGPGAAPTVADFFQTATPSFGPIWRTTIVLSSITETGTTATATTTTAHGFVPGETVFIQSNVAGYNGLQVVATVPTATTFTFLLSVGGLGAASAGDVGVAVGEMIIPNQTPPPEVGDAIVIAGTGSSFDNSATDNPANWPIVGVTVGVTTTIVFSFATGNPQGTYSGGGAGTVTIGGQSSPGVHQVVEMWLTRQGYISKPSPAGQFVSVGNSKWQATNILVGPSNVVARVFGFSGAGGDNFFIIPATVTLPNPTSPTGTPIVVQSTIVPDNTSASYVFDVPDNTLFASVAIDQVGNDLFDQVVLGPVLGFFAFASRLVAWGDFNKIQNFLSSGFESGNLAADAATVPPKGWTVVTAGGTRGVGGSWASGVEWVILTDNTGNPNGQISQPAYQDSFGDAILSPSTTYLFRAWIQINQVGVAGVANVVAEFFSPTAGSIAKATIALPNPTTAAYGAGLIAQATFSAATPVAIPADTVLRLSANATGFAIAPEIIIDDWEIVFAENPYRDNQSRWSYALNPEAFALTTGNLGPDDDESPIRCFALLRQNSLLETAEGVHSFTDTTSEPDDWSVNQLTRAFGALSVRAGDPGKFGTGDAAEDWALVASRNGAYLFAGSEFWKVSQEISRSPGTTAAQDPRKCWDDTNWAAEQTVVAKNDPAARRAYFALPIGNSTTPNVVFMLDYREMDTATQIASAPPLHITIQGKMRSSDLTRKWSVWNVAANDIEILVRPNNQRQLFFAGAPNSQAQAFGNIYSLDPTKLTDDDYGAIAPYYTTYFFTDHETEQGLGIGSDMHLLKRIHAFITGVGLVTITPIVNSLYNFLPGLTQRLLVKDTDQSNFLKSDLEWTTVGVRGQRIAFRISVQPLPGSTDVQLRLQKFIAGMMRDPVSPFRQSGV